jgi:chitinase
LSYYEICEKIRFQNWTYVFNDEQKAPYAYKGTDWVGFDDVKSIKYKTQYLIDNNLGGAMVWVTRK